MVRAASDLATEPSEALAAKRVPLSVSRGGLLRHLGTAAVFAVVTIVLLGIVYPLAFTGVALLAFPGQANGSPQMFDGREIGSHIVGQRWTQSRYFTGRPSAAGKDGYDPTATGATNLGPASKKLIDATRAAIQAQRKANPGATVPLPIDLVTSSASGIDPDISPQSAYYQAPRIAKVRHIGIVTVARLIEAGIHPRELGFLGEPHVNVLELNVALDTLTQARAR